MLSRVGLILVAFTLACRLPLSAQTLVTDIPVSGYPDGIAVNPGTNRIYVAVTPPNNGTPEVNVIDGASNTVIDTISTPKGAWLTAVNIATNRVYAAGCVSDVCALTVIDGNTDKILDVVPITSTQGIGIQGLAVNPVADRIYLSDASDAKVDVIDGNTNKIMDSISLGGGQPLGIAVDIALNKIAIALDGPYLYIASGVTDKIIGRATIGEFAANVAINPFTSEAYVTNETFAPSTIAIVNMQNAKVMANIATGNNPFGVCVDIFTNLVFITNTQDSTVAEVNGNTQTKVGSVTADSFQIDCNPATRLVYAGENNGEVVHVISE